MVALKPAQATSFLSRPDGKMRAVLLYGPDSGLVSERGQKLAALFAGRESPPGEVVRMDDSDLESDPDRLGVELLTMPMFGGAKIIRATAGRRINAAVRALMPESELAGTLIVEAGDLKRDEGLRGVFEKSAVAVAIPCYPDDGATLDDLVSDILKAERVSLSPEARQELLARLGADRVLSRAEIEKLVIFAHGACRIEIDHVEAIVGDASDLAIDGVIAFAASGDTAKALAECDRAVAAGENAQSVILAAQRHFQRLHKLRTGLDGGRSLDDLIRLMRPAPPTKAKRLLEQQTRAWTASRAMTALVRISEAVKAARSNGIEESVLAERLLIEIARLARAGQQDGRRPT